MSHIDNKQLEHLAELARLKLSVKEEEKFLKDLERILDYFKELQELDTGEVIPISGGADLKNVTREDRIDENTLTDESLLKEFPETEGGYLKVPPVF